MKVSLLTITKHGHTEIKRLRDLVEYHMCCPECKYTLDEAKAKYADAVNVRFIKAYTPLIFRGVTQHDLEYKCVRCGCEWIVQIEEPMKEKQEIEK